MGYVRNTSLGPQVYMPPVTGAICYHDLGLLQGWSNLDFNVFFNLSEFHTRLPPATTNLQHE